MKVVNRGLVLILPKAPFLSWVQELLGADAPMTLGELRQDATALLITEFEDDRAGKRCIRRMWQAIFEHELAAWEQDPTNWPANRTYQLFQAWIEIDLHSMVLDAADTALTAQPW